MVLDSPLDVILSDENLVQPDVVEYWIVDPGKRRIQRLVLEGDGGYATPQVLDMGDILTFFPAI